VEFNLATVHQAIAAAVPDRECIVWRDLRRSYGEVADRSRRFANLLIGHGLGMTGTFADSSPWESPHDHVGLLLYNGPEFLEATLGGHLARVATFNVNYRYVAAELESLLLGARPRALVFHARLSPGVAAIGPSLPSDLLLLQVADNSGLPLLPGALDFETALAGASSAPPATQPSPDDLQIVFTGGTTGLPKGVLWRIGEVLIGPIAMHRPDGSEFDSLEEVVTRATRRDGLRYLPTPPFIHGAGLWVAMGALASGGTIVIQDDPVHYDGVAVAALCERERVMLMSLVGDSMAVPLLDAFDARPHELALRFLSNTAAPLSAAAKARLLRHLPDVRIADGLGSSEAGSLGARTVEPTFTLTDDVVLLSADRNRELTAGEDEAGWLCTAGRHARGYFNDQAKTEQTFTTWRGRPVVISGDRARLTPEGRVELLGRDSLVINTGGEKVFTEEVEDRLRAIDGVQDAVVLGEPHPRWGMQVVAIVQLSPDAALSDDELHHGAARHLAGYKVPRRFLRTEQVRRGPNGKLDLRWAREQVVRPTSLGDDRREPVELSFPRDVGHEGLPA
jgi:acyl-CoA synthetase (AMP-forming)/AMP-acid ligase II